MMKKVFVSIFIFLCMALLPWTSQAQSDPRIEWKQIETDNAIWLFDANHQELVEHYIEQFKKAYPLVLSLFREGSRKVTFIITDPSDLANGSARVVPHPFIVLWPVLPNPSSSIGDFDDSSFELLVHEYTHILNMEPVHGWISPTAWIFGSVAKPNMMLPRWYTEGLAVFTESYFSENGGRLKSQHLEGMARSLTLEDQWKKYPLSQLNDYHLDWLGASRAYLFGGILWDSIYRDGGKDMMYRFNQSHSRRIPYLLNAVPEQHIGRGYQAQLQRAYDFWKQKTQEQIDIVEATSHLEGQPLPKKEDVQSFPSISPDGTWLAYISDSKYGQGDIYIRPRHPKSPFTAYEAKRVVKGAGSQTLTWHPAATGFVYEKLDTWDYYYRFFDLYYYDLKTNKSERVTKGERAHHPCFSPDGHFLYFLKNVPGTKEIIEWDWKKKIGRSLYRGKIGDNISYLTCPVNNTLLMVKQNSGGQPHIARFFIKQKEMETFFDEIPVHFVRWSHLGLLFSSSASGIENLYLAENVSGKKIKYKAITNSKTRVHQGELDPLIDDLYYQEYEASGPRLRRLKGAQWESLPDRPPQVPAVVDYTSDKVAKAARDQWQIGIPAPSATHNNKYKAESFSPWRYLYPNHWIPFLYIVDGGTIYQAQTSAGDPLGKNSYGLVGQWDTLTKKAGASFNYLNQSLPVSLGLGVGDFYSYFYNTRENLHFTNVSGVAGWRPPSDRRWQLLFRWNYSALSYSRFIFIRQGPQLKLGFSNFQQKAYQISPEDGWKFELGHRHYLADFGNIDYGETSAHIGSFWSFFLPKRHALYWGINGVYAPQLKNRFFATSTLAGPFQNPQLTNTTYLQRGYPTGVFVGNNLANTNLEYRFPLFSIFRGWTAPPLFIKNLQGNFVFDATTFDGIYSNKALQSSVVNDFNTWFYGYGLELHTNTTVGFHVPVTLTLGLYYGENLDAYGGFTTFFNVRL
ncbi:MAG: PD40 domain-containing protein [Bdellovibrionales bacterium]|nr:PD40 domain-containing protein [Bdellovibrionales bacterium]